MTGMSTLAFLSTVPPWDGLTPDELQRVADDSVDRHLAAGTPIFAAGDTLDGLFVLVSGQVGLYGDLQDREPLVLLGPRDAFGMRGLLSDGRARASAAAATDVQLLVLPAGRFRSLVAAHPSIRRFFEQHPRMAAPADSIATTRVAALMTADPVTVPADTPVIQAARLMDEHRISSLLVRTGDRPVGILTLRDISGRVVAAGRDTAIPVSEVMTPDPITLPADALGSDVLHTMVERRISHVPVTGPTGAVVGIISQTDLTRFQAETSADLIGELATAPDGPALAAITARIPDLLARLVEAGHRHEVVTRLITDIADAVTRRLLVLAEATLGPAPIPYLWLACGSQGRREQTGTSDQDNCLFLDDAFTDAHDPYFAALAAFVSDGLNACGYVYCPGGMMATNPRWRQPVRVWRRYFRGWIETPDPMSQMLASVMFDLRPISGATHLHEGVQTETLEASLRNSIFVAHMVSNAQKHAPPLGLLGGLTTLRSGEHRDTLDLKHNGVVPIVDLGRVYALRGRLTAVNTRARLEAARATGIVSETGGLDLIDAYDLIAETRLEHQARQARDGDTPDNFMRPASLSAFERSRLKGAFAIVRRMQQAATQGQGVL